MRSLIEHRQFFPSPKIKGAKKMSRVPERMSDEEVAFKNSIKRLSIEMKDTIYADNLQNQGSDEETVNMYMTNQTDQTEVKEVQ